MIQDVLEMRPPTENGNPAILSFSPSIWGVHHRVINPGTILGVRPTMMGRPEDVEHGVAMTFQLAGWPLQRIAEAFQPDSESPQRIDIALLGDDGQYLVAVEVKMNTGRGWRVSEA